MNLHMIFIFLSLFFNGTFIIISSYRIWWKDQPGTIDHFWLFFLGLFFMLLSLAT